MFDLFRYLFLLSLLTTGCISTGVSNIETDEGFDWNTLKRDQILMSPLLDLRDRKIAPAGQNQSLEFFSSAERVSFPEKFKQEFVRLRKDIRVFGAGGAFEHMSALKDLDSIARDVMAKRALSDDVRSRVLAGSQDIRFVFFFAVTAERNYYGVDYTFRSDTRLDLKKYTSTREMTIKLALWDSKENKTVWIATEVISPSSSSTREVSNPTKYLVSPKGKKPYWEGTTPFVNLETEIAESRDQFPSFPGREPKFSDTFDDFALALPIHPSEQKLIEYSNFTYHRPEAQLRTSAFGPLTHVGLQLGTSSVINYVWRVGGAFVLPLTSPTVRHNGRDFDLQMTAFGLTFDYEQELTKKSRLLVGVMAGSAMYAMNDPLDDDNDETLDQNESKDIVDGLGFAWPRIYLLFGEKGGFQWGVGAAYRYYDGLEKTELRAYKPLSISVDLGMSYAFRGF